MHTIDQAVNEIQSELIAFTQELVRIQSLTGEEEAIVRFAAQKMYALGYDHVTIDPMGNLIGQIGSGSPCVMFDSHLDTVAVTDAAEWDVAPFSGEIVDGRLYGRGSVDMKSGAAASIYAGVIAKRLGLHAGKSIRVSCTVLEEDCDGENLRYVFADPGLRPDFLVICEPSGNRISLGHKGKAQIVIRTQGISAHGSAPEKGLNAVYEMAEIIQRVEQTNARLAQNPAPRGTLVLSRIASTSASLNAVPSECEIYLDRRMVLGETEATIRAELDAIITGKRATWEVGILHRTSWTGMAVQYEPLHPAWKIAEDHPLTRACVAAYAHTFAAPPAFDYWDFSTNAVSSVGLGIPTIGFGPGEYKLAHMRNENCAVGQIVDACRFYTNVIAQL